MNQHAKKKSTRRIGRPSVEQSREIDERIKSAALDLFLERGFDAVSMESIAREANVTKTTLYARYSDKSELFAAAWRASKEEWSFRDVEGLAAEYRTLESQLTALGDALLEQALSHRVVGLTRMAVAQAHNFPEEMIASYSTSLSPRIRSVAGVLKLHEGKIRARYLEDVDGTAEFFLGLITGIPARMAEMGVLRAPDFERRRVRRAVRLFLDGILKIPQSNRKNA